MAVAANFCGTAGILRLFNAEFGGQISWLIPFALVALVAGLWIRRRAPRTDLALAGYLLWGGWFLVHAVVFSFMSGIIHTYYSVALAPAIAALVGAGVVDLWRLRARYAPRRARPGRRRDPVGLVGVHAPRPNARLRAGLGIGILVVGASAAVVLAFPLHVAGRRPSIAAAGLAMAVLLAGPLAYGVETIATAQNGGDPSAGPAVARSDGGFGGPGGGPQGNAGGGSQGAPASRHRRRRVGRSEPDRAAASGRAGGAGAGGPGGSVDQSVIDYLVANRGSATWLVATTSSGSAGSIELATGAPGHGHGRLHRVRPDADAGRAPGVRPVRRAPLRPARRRWRAGRIVGDVGPRRLDRRELHGRRHGLGHHVRRSTTARARSRDQAPIAGRPVAEREPGADGLRLPVPWPSRLRLSREPSSRRALPSARARTGRRDRRACRGGCRPGR